MFTNNEQKAPLSLKIVSHNVDDHPGYRFPNHPTLGYVSIAFPELEFKNRFPLLEAFYQSEIKKNTNLFALQEVGAGAVPLLKNLFEKHNFECIVSKYNLHEGSANYLFAYKKDQFLIKDTKQIYFTKTGKSLSDEQRVTMSKDEKIEHNFKVEFEKSAQVITMARMNSPESDFTIVNVQPGLTNEHRELAMDTLGKALADKSPTLMMGDFNQFDSTKNENKVYEKQRKILEDHGFQSTTKHLADSGLKATFIAHPYDVLRFFSKEERNQFEELKLKNPDKMRQFLLDFIEEKNIDLVSTTLDDCYIKGLTLQQCKTSSRTWFDNHEIDPSQVERAAFQKKYLSYYKNFSLFNEELKNKEEAKKPAIMSDHIALEIEFQL